MKEIQLTQGQVALVDDEDYNYLMQWKWYARISKCGYYAMRSAHEPRVKGKKDVCRTVLMHRVVMNTPKGMDVDHVDYDGLNNQKSNLRNCSRSQNTSYRRVWEGYDFKGITFHWGKYIAKLHFNGDGIWLGSYRTAEEAARAYDIGAIKLFKEFAMTNFPIESYNGIDIDKEFAIISFKSSIVWNKGLTKETSESVAKISRSKIGKVPWNKGKRKVKINLEM